MALPLTAPATPTSTNHYGLTGWLKWPFVGAAVWNIFGGISALTDPALHFSQMYSGALSLDEPLQLYFYRCVWINVIAWGIGYALAAFARGPHTAILVAGGMGKLFYCAACFALYATGLGKGMLLFAGIVDLLLALLFAGALLRSRQQNG